MSLLNLTLIALGLSMDAFAVAVASGLAIKNLKVRHALLIATFFGGFQALMPTLGWLAGRAFRSVVQGVDHWIAFTLLTLIGGKMIYEALKFDKAENPDNPLNILVLLVLAIATSIDALAVGVAFALLDVAIVFSVLVIGAVTFILSILGVYIGDYCGHFFEKKIEIIGGLTLIGIGLKILIEHLWFS
jgi:putative Mn2+ efflux pump MntP